MKLEISGEERIPASLDTVWAFLNDPEKVGRCFPESVDVTVQDPTHLEGTVNVSVGPMRGKFKVKVELVPDASRHHIDTKMSGGGFGSTVDLSAAINLFDPGDGTTLLKWSGQAEALGLIAAVGGHALEAQARKVIEQAFGKVREHLTA